MSIANVRALQNNRFGEPACHRKSAPTSEGAHLGSSVPWANFTANLESLSTLSSSEDILDSLARRLSIRT